MKRAIVFTVSIMSAMVLLFGTARADPLCPPTPTPIPPTPVPPAPLSFLDLTDTPETYAGSQGLVVAVNADGLVFTDHIGGDITIGRHLTARGNIAGSDITARGNVRAANMVVAYQVEADTLVVNQAVVRDGLTVQGRILADNLVVAYGAEMDTLTTNRAEIGDLTVATTARVGNNLYIHGDVYVGAMPILNVVRGYNESGSDINSVLDLPGSHITVTGNSLVYGTETVMGHSHTYGAIRQGIPAETEYGTRLRVADASNGYAIFSDGYVRSHVTIYENGSYGGQVGPTHAALVRWLVLDRDSGIVASGTGLLMEGQGHLMIGDAEQGLEIRFARPAVPDDDKGRFWLRHSGNHTYNVVLEIMWVND